MTGAPGKFPVGGALLLLERAPAQSGALFMLLGVCSSRWCWAHRDPGHVRGLFYSWGMTPFMYRFRSAVTGMFVTAKKALKNPKTTIKEKLHRGKSG